MTKKLIFLFVLLLATTAGAYYTYVQLKRVEIENQSLLNFIPSEQIEIVLHSSSLVESFNQFQSQSVLGKQFEDARFFEQLRDRVYLIDSILQLNHLEVKEDYLANYNSFEDFLYVAKIVSKEDADTITQTSEKENLFFKSASGRVYLSNKQELLRDNIQQSLSSDSNFNKVFNPVINLSFGINYKQSFCRENLDFFNSTKSNWGWYDINFSEQDFRINGLEYVVDSDKQVIEIDHSYAFIPQNISSLAILRSEKLTVPLVYDSLCNCNFLKEKLDWLGSHYMVFSGQFVDEDYLAIHIETPDMIEDQLESLGIVSDSTGLFSLADNKNVDFQIFFQLDFYPNYLTVIEDYVLLGINQDALNKLVYNYKNQNTLEKQIDIFEYLTHRFEDNQAKIKQVKKGFMLSPTVNKGVSSLTKKDAGENLELVSYDYTQKINLISNQEEAVWNLSLGANITFLDLIFNHRVNDKQLIVQDSDDLLYLINPAGKVLWKKQLNGKILGNIEQVDIYKNGKKQLLFNTSSKLYLLDVLGRDVNKFPVLLDSATNGVNAFDYENNGDYRFVVATKKGILNYDKEGMPINGWNVYQPKASIQQQIRYFSVSGKDYLLANDVLGNLYLLSRKGEIREPLANQYSSAYLPVDFGNDLSSSRTIYYDASDKYVKKHFFNNSSPLKVLFFSDSVEHFSYHSVTQSDDKQYLLFFKEKLEVYDKAGNKLEQYKLPPDKAKIKLYKNNIGVIHQLTNELNLIDSKLKEKVIYSNMTDYIIDEKNTYDRIYGVSGNYVRMIIKERK